jgi:c-di-GMP-binding flagellar brake protein YcgR
MGGIREMNNPSERQERREFPRIPKEVTVEANLVTYPVNETDFSKGKSKDISQGGILLHLNEQFAPGALLQVRITLPGWRKNHPGFLKVTEDSIGSPFTAVCEVVRTNMVGDVYQTAVKFVNIDEDDYRALKGYMKKQTAH